jgi:peptide/nickel transport system ATP-binding protein
MSAATTRPLVQISGLSVAYGRRGAQQTALRGFNLSIAPGETIALVGESGSGKSTAANAIIGLLPGNATITGGSIRINGVDTTHAKERQLRSIRGGVIGYIPQDPMVALNPTRRIGASVAEAVRNRGGVDRRQLSAEVIEALEHAGLDNGVLRARQYPHELSGGMRQRALIAIALAGAPQLLIADEPTSALDVTVQRRILDHLESLVRDSGISLLIITHDLGVAADRADRVLVMQSGNVVEQGDPEQILVAPNHEYSKRLIAAAPGLSLVARTQAAPRGDQGSAREILRLHGVSKDFALPRAPQAERSIRAVNQVDLTVHAGETVALVGESGSGKTTTLRIALGLETPTEGTVSFEGEQISGRSWRELRSLRQRFQLVHQNPFASLDPTFTIARTVTEPLASFHVGNSASRLARAKELMDQVALPQSVLSRKPAELSGGQRQRVAIARALALKPDLLLLDEPVSALDVSVQAQILDLLADLQRQMGLSYLFISHDLAVVSQLAHWVAVMSNGSIVEQGPTAQVLNEPATEYTKQLIDAIPGQRHLILKEEQREHHAAIR